MAQLDLTDNPFRVLTPEDMDASDVAELFVHPFTDFTKIVGPGHVMVNGSRGCGKSMIFRYLLADCQCIVRKACLSELPFLAFLVSIKNTGATPSLMEFRLLEDRHANLVLNEHVLTVFVAAKVFAALSRSELPIDDAATSEARNYLENEFVTRFGAAGGKVESTAGPTTPTEIFRCIARNCDRSYNDVVQYMRRLGRLGSADYTGALCGYLDFLLPLLQQLRDLTFLPSCPFYILIDDADYLNVAQTVVLNSWVSTRTQMDVSLKISTQLRYKTRATMSGLPIQSPHDFQEINISDLYTTRYGRYLKRMEEIVAKRLSKAGILKSPQEFFPCDEQQEATIRDIAERLRKEWPVSGKGHRPGDDALRYARPQFIRSLGGRSKSGSTYSYSGFRQLVHISSGLVRYFLEPAATMYDEQRSGDLATPVTRIEPGVQNRVCRETADMLMMSEMEGLQGELVEGKIESSDVGSEMLRLENLVRALGGTFYLKLISNDAERRVFSIAISGPAAADVRAVFELGVGCGYFHRSSIGNKDGTGRTRLYVLTRRLAPFFKLDPSSFTGYLWVTSEFLRKAIAEPDTVLRRLKNEGMAELEESQLTLFAEELGSE